MSRLETRVKPILIPLLTGTHVNLDKYNQEILATWIAMKLLIAEFSVPEDVSTPALERSLLMGRRLPPNIMSIWIAHYPGSTWQNTYLRQSSTLGWAPFGTIPSIPPGGSFHKNTQTQSFLIGELFVQAVTTTVTGVVFNTPPAVASVIRQIWPYRHSFQWPLEPIPDLQVTYITTAFSRFTSRLPFAPGPARA